VTASSTVGTLRVRATARERGMREVFACARMDLGTPPRLPGAEVFGVTSLELG